MKISFIGMSGVGKSYWSKKLEQQGFYRYCFDGLIEERLAVELKRDGFSGINDLSKWMGQPYEARYKQRSKRYLDLEAEVMRQILSEISSVLHKNIIIDTTGSVVYLKNGILSQMSKLTKVVYFSTPPSKQLEMYKLYLSDPKPVYWGKSFNRCENESVVESLGRCYPQLLKFRSKKYEKLSSVKISMKVLKSPGYGLDSLMKEISI